MERTHDADVQVAPVEAARVVAVLGRVRDLIGIFDADGNTVYMSPAAVTLFTGADPDEILAADGQDRALRIHPDDLEHVIESFSRCKEQPEEPVTMHGRTRHADGTWRHIEGWFINCLDDPRIRGIVLSVNDVTDRVEIEHELRDRLEIEAAIARIARSFVDGAIGDLDACVADALEVVGMLVDAERASVYLLDERAFHRRHTWHAPGEELAELTVLAIDDFAWAWEQMLAGVPIVVNRADELPASASAERETITTRGNQSVVAVALVARERPLGFVSFSADRNGVPWPVRTVSLVEQLAALLTTAIERNEAEVLRKRSEEAIRTSAERFRRLVTSSPDLVIVLDPQARITFASPAAKDFGYEPEELLGRSALDLLHPDDAGAAAEAITRTVASVAAKEVMRMRVLHRDGHYVPVETLGSNLFDDALVQGLIVNVRDVSERVKIAETLLEVEHRFQLAWEHAPVGMAFADAEGSLVKVNPAFCRMLGYDEADLLVLGIGGIVHPEVADRTFEHHRQLFDGEIDQYVYGDRLLRADGSWMWAHVTVTLVRDSEGTPLYALGQIEDVTDRREFQERLEHDATHDALTGLPLRSVLLDHLDLALANTRRNGTTAAVMFVDLDYFKRVNDSFGHATGDALLVDVAKRIRSAIRDGDTAGRFGGDEFVVVCPDLAHDHDVARIAERIRALLAQPFSIMDTEVFVGASIGIAIARPGVDSASLLREADSAAYRAKARGRNRYEIFDDQLRASVVARVALEHAVRKGLADDEFVVHYQPIIEARSTRIVGFEALVRWARPGHGLLHPADFLRVAEESGLVVPLGERVLASAATALAAWEAVGDEAPVVAVNLSPRQLAAPEIVDAVREAIERSGASPSQLWLEIPETLLVHDTPQLVARLEELDRFGVRLALDDFGTGYSSLNHLRYLPVGALKIDRSFIAELGCTPQGETIVRSVIELAHALDLRVIAEGVESRRQLDTLRALGCDWVQGFLFSPALAAADATAMLRRGTLAPA